MSFRIAQKSLERLEWPQVVERWQRHCRTPQARRRLSSEPEAASDDGDRNPATAPDRTLFEGDLALVHERLAETSEARALLDGEQAPALGGVAELASSLARAERGGALTGVQLQEVAASLAALHATRRFLLERAEAAPRLAAVADTIEDLRDLERAIDRCIDGGGEVRNDATSELRSARSESSRLAGELQARLARTLQNPDVAGALSDAYYTVRNDRYVLPVRADMRGRVRGIVHDASGSGTTLFIEPEGLVELNNRLKQAELEVARQVQRVLRDLSARVASVLAPLRAGLDSLGHVDLAFARGQLSREMDAVEPAVSQDGVIFLPQLRHPLIPPDETVANDIRLGEDFRVMVVSGPNGGGKTVAMKAVALAALFVRAGLHVPADPGSRVDLVDAVLADIGDDQDIRESLSTFSAHMANVAEIVHDARRHSLVVLDEIGVGTDPGEGSALAQSVLERLADSGALVIATTHYNLLKEMAAVDPRFCNASVEFDAETLAPTYRLHLGSPGASSATAVAARMGMPADVLERANALLEREDRQLDHMLSELSASRASLEREQQEVARLREEGEAARSEYRDKLERLQARRDQLFHAMRDDLDRSFKDAHAQVAAVIRDLQRGGTARDAARARTRLQALEEQASEAEARSGVRARDEDEVTGAAVDWRHARPGDPVQLVGGGRAVIESLPDRRGRVGVRVGSARVSVSADRLRAAEGGAARPSPPKSSKVRIERAEAPGGAVAEGLRAGATLHCDLRGERVEAALDRVADALDRAARDGHDDVRFVHGFGTGALRNAVREHLRGSPYVARVAPADPEEGGDGVTIAALRR